MLGNVGNILLAFRPSSKGDMVVGGIYPVTFHRTSNDVQVSLCKLDVLDIVDNGDGEVVRA